jgi:EAL domain-containing protein (putative c-di-GMP-specific phosphodiesterase class I)
VTVGGALYGPDGVDADTICQNADFALYQAKQTHRGGYVGFRPDLRTAIVERMAIVRQLDTAMSEGRVVPHYQPIVRLETAEIVGLEALARLVMPDGSIVPAGAFSAGLDDPRIAYQLTGQMLDQVARDIRFWLDQGIPFQHVGVNVTTGDFARGDLADRVSTLFAAHDVPLSHVVLEVNESVFMGATDRTVPHAVEALRAKGILVALDDFGTGFASLTHLLSFPVDVIKIDRSFVERLGADQPNEVVVRAILEIASKLDMRVIAEGIETTQQVAVLRQFGCQMGQGYLFSRPVPVEDATRLMRLFAQKPLALPRALAGATA